MWAIVLTTVFIIFDGRNAVLIQGDACEPFFVCVCVFLLLLLFFFCAVCGAYSSK